MYKFPHGTEELEGIANRTDFDLGSHTKNQSEFNISAKVMDNKKSISKLAVQNINNKNERQNKSRDLLEHLGFDDSDFIGEYKHGVESTYSMNDAPGHLKEEYDDVYDWFFDEDDDE